MVERLQKIISRYGIASRRQAENMLQDGRITVNGVLAAVGDSADPEVDEISVDGKILELAPKHVYIMLNKPRGYITTLQDEKGRKNVSELVADCGCRVYPVGRLDQYSEGLLLMTNDGDLTQALTHPKGSVKKTYHVWVSGYYQEACCKMQSSIEIDGRKSIPAQVRVLSVKGNAAMLEVILREGRNRQIRRLCEFAGITVTRLKRVAEGNLHLGDLAPGKWRLLTNEEISVLKKHL